MPLSTPHPSTLADLAALTRAPPVFEFEFQTVCTYWLRGLCMKGDSCGFLHQV
jgi:hypothetical protein